MADRGLRKHENAVPVAHRPVRVFEGEQRPFERFWKVVDEADSESGEAEIQFYGYISEFSWFGDEVTPQLFAKDLKKLGGRPVTVRIHSGGGEVFAASAIRSMIMEYPGKVTARIDGLCASAATFVATAADVVKMQDSAFFMVHDPWCLAMGSADELKTAAKMLETIKGGIVETYMAKTDQERGTLERWMRNETWFTAQEAMEAGFVDEVISAPGAKRFDGMGSMAVANAVRDYANAPEEVRKAFTAERAESTEVFAMDAEMGERLRNIILGDDGKWNMVEELEVEEGEGDGEDVAEEGGASETPEAEAEEDGAQGEDAEAEDGAADEDAQSGEDGAVEEDAQSGEDGAVEEDAQSGRSVAMTEDGAQDVLLRPYEGEEGAADEDAQSNGRMPCAPTQEAAVDEREVKSLRDYIEVFG